MSLLSQGCQYSDGARSIGAQDKADFENSESGISIHYDGGNAARYIATLLHICICMHIYVCYYKPLFYCTLRSVTARFSFNTSWHCY